MPEPHPKDTRCLVPAQVLELATTTLESHLAVPVKGYRCSAQELFHLLTFASVERTSIQETCASFHDTVSANTVRWHLAQQLPQGPEELGPLATGLNRALMAWVPGRITHRWQHVAIDLTLVPYHGGPARERRELRRGPAKGGTTWFHAYATAYLIYRGKRLTLALTPVWADTPLTAVLTILLDRVEALKVRIRSLYLDKAFCTVAVLRLLKARGVPFVIPMPMRGRKGGRRLSQRGSSYRTTYTLRNPTLGQESVEKVVVRCYRKGRRGQRGSDWLAYAVSGVPGTPYAIRAAYRRRFGMESSYRCMNRVRARTSSRHPGLRLLLVGIAFLLVNLWVYVRWAFLGQRRRGGRALEPGGLRLARFARFLQRAVQALYSPVWEVRPAQATHFTPLLPAFVKY